MVSPCTRTARMSPPPWPPRQLELKLQCQLSNASIYSRAADDAERGRRKISVGVRKLGMVQRIVKLGAKLKTALLSGPVQRHGS